MNSTKPAGGFAAILATLLATAVAIGGGMADSERRTYPINQDGYFSVEQPREWAFPRDFGRHDGFALEWWYFTGNLRAFDDGGRVDRELGFQLTWFRSELTPQTASALGLSPRGDLSPWRDGSLYFGHFAISDITGRTFHHAERISRGHPDLARAAEGRLDVALLDWKVWNKGPRTIRMQAADGGAPGRPDMAVDLTCRITRGPIFHGPGGVNEKGDQPGQASYYYSLTRLETTGTVTVDGQTRTVRGLAWMDHEFSSNQLGPNQEGWDWFALQLDDGRDVMAYRLRNPQGENDHAFASVVAPDGSVQWFPGEYVRLVGTEPWTSDASGGSYPQTWKLTITDPVTNTAAESGTANSTTTALAVTVRSRFPGQELTTEGSTDISYFEGGVEVLNDAGERLGTGYMELVGYAESLADAF